MHRYMYEAIRFFVKPTSHMSITLVISTAVFGRSTLSMATGLLFTSPSSPSSSSSFSFLFFKFLTSSFEESETVDRFPLKGTRCLPILSCEKFG